MIKDLLLQELKTYNIDETVLKTLNISEKGKGDYTLNVFALKNKSKNLNSTANQIKDRIKTNKLIEHVEVIGPYINLFLNRSKTFEIVIKNNMSFDKKNKTIVVEYSSPNIAKHFGIGHLRSTIIGNSLYKIFKFMGYETVSINYLGDWGTQFGLLILAYQKFGDPEKLKHDPITHLNEIYVKINSIITDELKQEARDIFKLLENKDPKIIKLWKLFREISIQEFKQIYDLFNIRFDVIEGESDYIDSAKSFIKALIKSGIATESDDAIIVDLNKYKLGVAVLQKKDGTTIYTSRDLAAALSRFKRFNFTNMIYEVGSEQKIHFKQMFKIFELINNDLYKKLIHVDHGLYLDKDSKKLSTRKGKSIKFKEIWDDVYTRIVDELKKRYELNDQELISRANIITRAAIFYADLKTFRQNNMIFDIQKMTSFDGQTGPYLLYSYARARSILRKQESVTEQQELNINDLEFELIKLLDNAKDTIIESAKKYDPSKIANYCYVLAKSFNVFYVNNPVLNNEFSYQRKLIVDKFTKTLKTMLSLLGIDVLEIM